jgi:hypothetical protein
MGARDRVEQFIADIGRRIGGPLRLDGEGVCATRAVSSGTGPIGLGLSDTPASAGWGRRSISAHPGSADFANGIRTFLGQSRANHVLSRISQMARLPADLLPCFRQESQELTWREIASSTFTRRVRRSAVSCDDLTS